MRRYIPILIIGTLLHSAYAQDEIIEKDAPVINRRASILETSTLFSSGGFWTIIPKGSVIQTPQSYQKNIVSTPKGKLAPWKDFLRKNSGWIYTFEVSREQASGTDEIDPKKLEAYLATGKVVVAIHNGTPIRFKKVAQTSAKNN